MHSRTISMQRGSATFNCKVAAIALCAIAVVGCTKVSEGSGGAQSSGSHPWTQAGVFRFSEGSDPKNLNVLLDAASPTLDLSMFIFSYAIRYNSKAKPVADALREIPTVANGDVSKDGLTLKYKLRPGIKWQDGAPLTCNDLRFTWQVVMNPHNNVVTTDGYKSIGSIDCSNPLVAVIHMKKLYAPFLQQLWSENGNAPILPEHLLAQYNDAKGSFNTAPFNSMPVGSGPFKVVAWDRGQDVRMVANPYFYLGKPKLNEVIYDILARRKYRRDAVTDARDRYAGDGHGHEVARVCSASCQSAQRLSRNARGLVPLLAYRLQPASSYRERSERARCVSVRHRSSSEIISKLLHGSAIAAETDQSPELSWAYTNDITHYPFDPEKAKAILDADGWKVGPDGVRVKNGQRLEFSLEHTDGIELRQSAADGVAERMARRRRPSRHQELPDEPVLRKLEQRHFDRAVTTTWQRSVGTAPPIPTTAPSIPLTISRRMDKTLCSGITRSQRQR